jgi:probable HAF family extracellular repeat protein
MHRARLSVVLSLSVLLSTLVAAQDASYTFTTFDVPGGEGTQAFGINVRGQIVGYFSYGTLTGAHGFLKDGTTFTTVDVPGSTNTFARGINEGGQIVGSFNSSGSGRHHGFVTDGVTFTPIEVPNAVQTFPHGINNRGQIVGSFDDGTRDRGFVTDGVTFTPIDDGAGLTEAYGINDGGQVVGFSGTHGGFLWDGTTFTSIEVPDAVETRAHGINNYNQIVGSFVDATTGSTHGFVTDGVTFITLDAPGASYTEATGINDHGQIVGWFWDAAFQHIHSFLATPAEVDTTPPVITVAASPATLWPPNGQQVAVTVSGTITDEDGGSGVKVGSAAYVVMDEYGQIQPKGSVTLKSNGSYSFTISLQASRNGNDPDGRHYTIAVSANDNAGNLGVASATVTVPRN